MIDWNRLMVLAGAIFLTLNAKYQWFAPTQASELARNAIEFAQLAVGAYLFFAVKPPPKIEIGDGKD